MNTYAERFRSVIVKTPEIDPHDERLLVERHGRFSCHYAPFDHLNRGAKIVLVGITPGSQQAGNALAALHNALRGDVDDAQALELAKKTASFSGPMRNNLIAMLDRIGLPAVLGVESCARLFDTRSDLAHFTSALRYPVFVDGKDYSGSPSILATPALRDMALRWLQEEIEQLRHAFWVPLGKEPAAVLVDCVARGALVSDQVLTGMPHPSGANAERIAYFLGNKERNNLSAKTNPTLIDAARVRLVAAVTSANGAMKQAPTRPTTHEVESMKNERPQLGSPDALKSNDIADAYPLPSPARTVMESDSRIATTFHLVDHSNEAIYPIRIKNRITGNIAFVLAPRGTGTHTREHAIEVADEGTAYEMVRSGTFKIRATRDVNVAPSLLGLGNRAVKDIVRL